jgi:hypothetical protein
MGEWPALRGTLADAAAAQVSGTERIFRGDVRSANWNGGGDLSGGSDSTATQGYLIDYSSGSAQFQNIFAEGGELTTLSILGNLTMGTGGVIRTAASGVRIELTNTDSGVLNFYTNFGAETVPAKLISNTAGNVQLRGIETVANSGDFGFVQLDASGTVSVAANNGGTLNLAAFGGGIIVSQHQHRFDAGSASLPGVAFDLDPDTGIRRSGTNTMGFVGGGVTQFTTGNSSSPGLRAIDGTVSLPGIAFDGDPDTGPYHPSADQYAIAAGGVEVMALIESGGAAATVRFQGIHNETTGNAANVYVNSAGKLFRSTA